MSDNRMALNVYKWVNYMNHDIVPFISKLNFITTNKVHEHSNILKIFTDVMQFQIAKLRPTTDYRPKVKFM
jgi:hypothetical protein